MRSVRSSVLAECCQEVPPQRHRPVRGPLGEAMQHPEASAVAAEAEHNAAWSRPRSGAGGAIQCAVAGFNHHARRYDPPALPASDQGVVKRMPSGRTLNTVPKPERPPNCVVRYSQPSEPTVNSPAPVGQSGGNGAQSLDDLIESARVLDTPKRCHYQGACTSYHMVTIASPSCAPFIHPTLCPSQESRPKSK